MGGVDSTIHLVQENFAIEMFAKQNLLTINVDGRKTKESLCFTAAAMLLGKQ